MNTTIVFDNFDPEKDLQEMADLGTYSVSIGFYEEAKRALLRLTEVEPDEAIWTILLAEILVAEGETDQALSILYDIPETDTDYPKCVGGSIGSIPRRRRFRLSREETLKSKKTWNQMKRLLIFTLEHYYLKREVSNVVHFLGAFLKTKSSRNWGRRTCTRTVR